MFSLTSNGKALFTSRDTFVIQDVVDAHQSDRAAGSALTKRHIIFDWTVSQPRRFVGHQESQLSESVGEAGLVDFYAGQLHRKNRGRLHRYGEIQMQNIWANGFLKAQWVLVFS